MLATAAARPTDFVPVARRSGARTAAEFADWLAHSGSDRAGRGAEAGVVARVRSRRGRRGGRRAPRRRPPAAGRWCAPSRTARRGATARPASSRAARVVVEQALQRGAPRCGSRGPGTSTPAVPDARVGSPPTAAATTGVPQACASMATSPNDSLYDGTATRSALRYHWTSCSPVDRRRRTGPAPSIPSRAARRSSWRGVSRPVPLGPPSTATTRSERSSGRRASRSAAARSSTSGRLERLDPARRTAAPRASAREARPRPGRRPGRRG